MRLIGRNHVFRTLGLATILVIVAGSLNSFSRITASSFLPSRAPAMVSDPTEFSRQLMSSPSISSCSASQGDINGDGEIDTADMALLLEAMGSTPSSSNWKPKADLNGDGIVDISDLSSIGRNFLCGVSLTDPSFAPGGVQIMLDAMNTGQTDIDCTNNNPANCSLTTPASTPS